MINQAFMRFVQFTRKFNHTSAEFIGITVCADTEGGPGCGSAVIQFLHFIPGCPPVISQQRHRKLVRIITIDIFNRFGYLP